MCSTSGSMSDPTRLTRLLPFLGWRGIDRPSLTKDLLAGLTVALLVIPQSLAYAQLAGLPAHYGLYSAFIPAIVGVLFGSSALLSTGPVALTSLLTAASVGLMASAGSRDYIGLVIVLSLLSGLCQIAFGLARAGALMSLISHPVLVGFINAAALIIAFSQLPALAGISVAPNESFLVSMGHMLANVDGMHLPSLAIGAGSLAALYFLRKYLPRLPGVLIVMAAVTVLSQLSGFGAGGGAIVGEIPRGLPGLAMPDLSWKSTASLLPSAFLIALVSFLEASSSCKTIAARTRTRWDINQELVGQGLAKIAGAFSQSMPVSGSFSRSALNLALGAKTGMSSVFAAGFVLLALLFFTPSLFHLPKPALAALIILAVIGLIDIKSMRNAWHANREDGLAAVLTFTATIAFAPNVQIGMLAGIVFSLGAFIYRRMVPQIVPVRLHLDGTLRQEAVGVESPVDETVAALRFDAGLFFANVAIFENAVLSLERHHPKIEIVLIVGSGINLIDASAVEMLRALNRSLRERKVSLIFSGMKPQVMSVIERTGLRQEIGEAAFFDSDTAALAALRDRAAAEPTQDIVEAIDPDMARSATIAADAGPVSENHANRDQPYRDQRSPAPQATPAPIPHNAPTREIP